MVSFVMNFIVSFVMNLMVSFVVKLLASLVTKHSNLPRQLVNSSTKK